jgi:hypothetical protein
VLWDNLTALQPATLKDAQIALFIHKLPRHISAMINTRSFDMTQEMLQPCNQLWASQTPEEAASAAAAAAATAGPWQHSSLRNAHARRSPSPYPVATRPATKRTAAAARPPLGQQCFYHSRFGNKAHKCERGCTYQDN